MILTKKYDLEKLKEMAKNSNILVYSISSCWWKIGHPVYQNGKGLPCGPRGEMLLETDDPFGFLLAAEKSAHFYGKHGIDALVNSHHENITTNDGRPTSLSSWEEMNELLEQQNVKVKQ